MTSSTRPPSGLDAVVGHWRTHGQVPGADPVPVEGTDTYELLEGGHFLVHHVDVRVGSQPVIGFTLDPAPDSRAGGVAMDTRFVERTGLQELLPVCRPA